MKERSLSQQWYFNVLLYVLLFLSISFAVIHSFMIDKHLSADGSHYFRLILDGGNFTNFAWARKFANYLTQWSLVVAVNLGLKDVLLLSRIYAIGLYFPYVISFALCIYAIRKENTTVLVFPLISMIGINLSTDYILIGEHHVMVLFAWPILLLSLRREPLTWLDGAILWILLALFSRTYEAAVISAIIFSLIFAIKLYQFRHSKKQVFIYGISLFLCFVTLAIASCFIFNPRDSSNKSSFVLEIVAPLKNNVALAATGFTIFFATGLIRRKTSFILISLFPIAFYSCILLFGNHGLTASQSFASRTLSLSLLPFLLICAIISVYRNVSLNRTSTKIFVLFVLVMVLGNVRFSGDWYNFRNQIVNIVTTNNGYISIEETAVKDNPYRWGFNNPELGIILSYPCVRAILLNSSDMVDKPFDPREELVLKNYVSYETTFSTVDNDIKTCQ